MKQTVYVDVLVSVNIIIDYFLLYAAAVIAGRRKERLRLCLASLIGGATSLTLLLPQMPEAANMIIMLISSGIMTLTAFGRSTAGAFARTVIILYVLSAAYSGAMLLVWCLTPARNIYVNNGAVYINISPAKLIFTTLVMYAAVSLLSGRLRSRNMKRCSCSVTVFGNGSSATVTGVIDTGNVLVEPMSGVPVIVVPEAPLRRVLPAGLTGFCRGEYVPEPGRHMRLVPYDSAGGSGVLAAYAPERIDVDVGERKYRNVRAYLAVAPDDSGMAASAVVNPDAVDF